MKSIVTLCSILSFTSFISCKKNETLTGSEKLNPVAKEKKDSIIQPQAHTDCDYSTMLSNPKTPKMAKELFNNTAKLTDEPLDYFDYILNGTENEKKFYFRVITNSYQISDGAYSEGLGSFGKEYIENHPEAFASFFDQTNCFNDNDLKTWAKIAVLEFEIIDDNVESNKKEALVYGYCRKLINDSKKFPESKRKTITKFTKLLSIEWGEFLKHID